MSESGKSSADDLARALARLHDEEADSLERLAAELRRLGRELPTPKVNVDAIWSRVFETIDDEDDER